MAPPAAPHLGPSPGLEWEPRPSEASVTWADALASATAAGWRLPSAAELMGFLGALPAGVEWVPVAGATFWSGSGSPFAPESRVRAVCCEPGGRLVIVLLEKVDHARCWRVRSGTR